MDLMIDCMPLYEMIEDDMKNIAANLNNSNLSINSNSASPSCLSDEEQLALTSCSIFDDLFFFTPTTTTTNSNQSNNINNSNSNNTNNFEQITSVKIENDFNQRPNYNCTLSLNESFNSSNSSSNSSSSSSSAVCSPLSSPLSLSLSSSSLCAALASTNFTTIHTSPSQHHQQQQNWDFSQLIDNNQYSNTYQSDNQLTTDEDHQSVSPVNTQSVMQDSYMNNNFSLYHVINPLDLNRNYTSNNLNILQSQDLKQQNDNKQNSKQSNLSYTHQQIKRSKFSHTNTPTTLVTSTTTNNLQLKHEALFNSDGESIGSNESNDSNSSYCSNNIDYTKQQLIKIEPFQLKNLTNDLDANSNLVQLQQQQPQILNVNNSTQINLIKINHPKENKTNSTTTLNNLINSSNSTCLKLPITTTKLNDNQNHKTIIQYKQLLNTNSNPIKLQQQQQQQQNSIANTNTSNKTNCTNLQLTNNSLIPASRNDITKVYPKPPYSYSCLIAMALRNSDTGNLPVSDIYDFIIENFPYYKTARDGWKNSIRHNLSLNKCFEKIENPTNGSKKGCLWALNPDKCKKLEEECKRCRQRDPINIRLSMSRPDELNKIERGEQRIKKFTNQNQRKTCETANSSNQTSVLSPTNGLNQSTDQLLTNDSFLLEWANNKNSTFVLKEEDDFEDSDIKFDSILLSTISPTLIRNFV